MTDPDRARLPRAILDDYLAHIRLRHPADAAQQYQVALLQQWVDHLAAVLDAEPGIPGAVADRIIRGVIWGSVPQQAEAELRGGLVEEMILLHERTPPDPGLLRDLRMPPP